MYSTLGLIIFSITSFSNVLLTLIVYIRNPKSATNRIFGLLGVVITAWLVAMYVSLIPMHPETSIFWIRLTIFLATPMSTLFLLLAHTLPSDKLRLHRGLLISLIIETAIVMLLTISPYAFTRVYIESNIPNPVAGYGLIPFGIFVIFCIVGAIYFLFSRMRTAVGIQKEQLRQLMIGILLMYGFLIFTVFLPVSLFRKNSYVIFTPLYTLTFLVFTTYAIIKHKFLDIKLVLARTVSFTLLLGFIGLIYASVFSISTYFFSNASVDLWTLLTSTVVASMMALTFQPIRRGLEKITDKFLYKDRYETNVLLYNLALIMASTLSLNDLTTRILNELLGQMRVARGMIVSLEKNNEIEVSYLGFPDPPKMDKYNFNFLLSQNRLLIFDELPENSTKQIMRNLGFTAIIPLKTEQETSGLLALGEKMSGEIYTSEDIHVLEIIAPEIAVAVQNARAYEEIRKFNITLTQEVDKATKDLKVANQKLEEVDRLKDDFVSIASHELRTPMTAIRSYVWMALYKPDIPLSEKLKKYLSRTLISTERLINLVNDMLNISRIESGRVEVIPTAFDIQKLIDDVIAEISVKAKEKNLNVESLQNNVPQVFADPDKIHQVLLNLVGNAMKFTPVGGSITISFFSDGHFVEISIKDSGVGISPDDLSRLFKKFGRLDNSYVAAATSGGTGLGLFICKNLIELMKGKIWAKSEGVNKGTTFTFSLPVATQDVISHAEKFSLKLKAGEAKFLEPVAI